MTAVRLIWRTRVPKKRRAAIVKWVRQHYDSVKDRDDYLELKAPKGCTKFIWIFMLSKAFKEIE